MSAATSPKILPVVFVVDDEKIIALTLTMILIAAGFRAIAFLDPLEVLQAAQALTPDLMISDVVMPHMSGIDLAIQFRALCPNSKVLLISGQTQTSDLLDKAKEDGYDFNIIGKPIHPTDLLAALNRL